MKASLFLLVVLAWPHIALSDCGSGSPACHALSAQQIQAAIRAVGPLAGESGEEFRVEVLDQSRAFLPDGELTFSIPPAASAAPDGVSVLHGHLDTNGAVRHAVWARVRMSVKKMAPVARLDLAIGTVLNDEQWELAEVWTPFPESIRENSTWDGKAFTGARLKRTVRQGEVLRASWLDYPLDIRRGQVVDLHVQSGGSHLRLQATALSNARRGESVEVRLNNERGPGLLAVTSGPGRAVLETTARTGVAALSTGNGEGKR